MKKLLALLLVILMTLTVFAACKSEGGDESSTDASSQAESQSETSEGGSEDKYKNEDGDYAITLDYIDFQNREFRILLRGSSAATYQSNDFTPDSELYGDTLNVAVEERNRKVEETYNIKLVALKSDSINADIDAALKSSEDLYDVIMPTIPKLVALAQDGSLYDLKTINNLDLNAPWWEENANSAFTIMNKLFFTLGDITILNKVCTPSVIFNKDLISNLGLENPYDLVNEKKWTFDKMYTMAVEATADIDGEEGLTTDDRWGILTGYGDLISFYGAANQTLCQKDGDDLPFISFTNETSLNIAQAILEKLVEKGTWAVYAQDFPTDIWVNSLAAFADNRILFRPSAFSAMTKLRAFDVNFGIVPMPMWSEEQDSYISYCGTGEVVAAAIPLCAGDPNFSGYMLELYSCEAKNYITPAYMEVNLKAKDTRDSESLEMLKIIFSNIVYDVGEVYNFGSASSTGLKNFLSNLVSSGSPEVVSKFDAIKNGVEADIAKVINNYKNF